MRITTGFVEPHFFAGFSRRPEDGRARPGRARDGAHAPRRRPHRRPATPSGASSRATRCTTTSAPIAAAAGVDFALDVTLNREQQIVRAFGGELLADAPRGLRGRARDGDAAVPTRFDVVVTTNSGFPLDQNLYQAVKGMSRGVDQVVRAGGTIVCAAECRDGFPDHGSYREVLASEAVAARRCSTRSRRATETVARPVAGAGPGADPGPGAGRRAHRLPHRRRRCAARTSATPTTSSATVARRARRRRPRRPRLRAARGPADDPVRRLTSYV